jgi:acyl-CoA synthetase (NDP forming)
VELFSAAKCLASRYRPVGKRLAIITNGGGPGVLAADWENEIGLDLGRFSSETCAALAPKLPPLASLADLIDLSEEAGPEHYRLALEAAFRDKQIDGLLAIFSPKAGADAEAVATVLADAKRLASKPLLSCWMGDASVVPARRILRAAQIPTFRTPEAAVGAFGNIASFYQNQQLLQQTPPPLTTLSKPDIEGARLVIESVLAERRNVLTEMESKTLLAAFHIPVTKTLLARSSTCSSPSRSTAVAPRHSPSVSATRERSMSRRARNWLSGGNSIARSLMSSIIVPPAPKVITGPKGSSRTRPMQVSRPRRPRAIFCTVTPLMRAPGCTRATRCTMSV